MLQKVKKFRDKLFSNSSKRESALGAEAEDSTPSSSFKASPSVRKSIGPDSTGDVSQLRKNSSVTAGHNKGYGNAADNSTSPTGKQPHLPPVQISGSFSKQPPTGLPAAVANNPALAQLSSAMSPASSGRRKSTPAALDMALRTAEGKAAVEELLNVNSKKMAFPSYFVGQNGKPQQAQPDPTKPSTGRLAKLGSSTKVPTISEHESEQPLQQTTSQEAARHVPSASHELSKSQKKPMADSVSSFAAREDHAAVPAPAPTTTSQSHSAMPRTPIAEIPPPPSKRTKLLHISPSVPAAMNRKYWSLSDYNVVRKMYTGYASTVYQAMCNRSLEMVALKVYHMENLCELNHYQVYREIKVHSALHHQNIVHLYAAFQEGTDVVLVQEYAEGGDLYRLLHKNGGRLSERQAVEMVLHPFLLSLHYLHTRGIMHRDIKPENVLFTEHRVLKLADFGLAIDLNEERAVTRAGTLDYMAPEVLRCPPKNLPQENKNNPYLHYNNSVDAWAVGVFAYELIVGFPPFAGETQLDSVDRIMHHTPEFPEKISELAKDFICQALKKHPGDRPTVMEMLHHPWIRTYQRRTSMRIPAVRRRSSVTYNPGAPNTVPEEEGPPTPAPGDNQDYSEMTPEQIEEMIRKLQFAKQVAINRVSKGGR